MYNQNSGNWGYILTLFIQNAPMN